MAYLQIEIRVCIVHTHIYLANIKMPFLLINANALRNLFFKVLRLRIEFTLSMHTYSHTLAGAEKAVA